MEGPQLDVTVHNGGGRRDLLLAGELDLVTVDVLVDAVREALRHDLECLSIDLREVVFIDSTGLRTILTAVQRARDADVDVQIVKPRPAVHRVFEMAGVDRRLPLVDAPDD